MLYINIYMCVQVCDDQWQFIIFFIKVVLFFIMIVCHLCKCAQISIIFMN